MATLLCRLRRLRTAIALVVSVALVAGAADTALAQTPPELKFLNDSLTKRAKHGGQEARGGCPPEFNRDVETATAIVFVLLSGNQEATSIEFQPEVPAAGSEVPAAGSSGLSPGSFNQLVDENRLIVRAEAAKNEQPGLFIKPSDVKAFDLTFLICSKSESPGLWYYLWNTEIPIEWSSFAGQLVVRDADNAQIGPGTVALQLNRPALGYERTYFTAISLATLLWAVVLLAGMYLSIKGNRWSKLKKDLSFDFKTGLVIPSTAAAAILGMFVSTTILPSDTFFMSKGQYATLNVVFGLVALVAGIVYNNHRKGWIFLIGAGLALGAAGGEAVAIWFVLKEMAFQGSLPAGGAIFFQIAVAATWLLISIFALRKVVTEINKPARSAAEYPL